MDHKAKCSILLVQKFWKRPERPGFSNFGKSSFHSTIQALQAPTFHSKLNKKGFSKHDPTPSALRGCRPQS